MWKRTVRTGAGLALAMLVVATPASAPAQSADDLFNDQQVQRLDLYIHSVDWERLKATYLENTYYACDLWFKGQAVRNAGVRSRGSSSRSPVKPALRIDFNRYVSNQTFLGLKAVVLKNLTRDPSFVHEFLAMKLHAQAGGAAPREAFVTLYVNNTFLGLYTVVEEIDGVAADRLFGAGKSTIFEFDGPENYRFEYLGTDLTAYQTIFPATTDEKSSLSKLYGPFESWTRAVSEASEAAFVSEAAQFVDFDRLLRFAAGQAFVAETDGFLGDRGMNGFYLNRPNGTTLHHPIAWDEDQSFADPVRPVTAGQAENVLMRRAMEHGDLRRRFFELLRDVAAAADEPGPAPEAPGWLEAEARRAIETIRPAVRTDTAKPFTNDEFEDAAARAIAFARQRGAFVRCEIERIAGGVEGRSCGEVVAARKEHRR
jgi:spore coat protein CotH